MLGNQITVAAPKHTEFPVHHTKKAARTTWIKYQIYGILVKIVSWLSLDHHTNKKQVIHLPPTDNLDSQIPE